MIFNRGRVREQEPEPNLRVVETETLNRWRNTAIPSSESENKEVSQEQKQQDYTVFEVPLQNSAEPVAADEEIPLSQRLEEEQGHSPAPENKVAACDFNLSAEEDLKRRFGTIRSALGPGTVIEGTFRFDSPVCIDGTLTGEVCSSSALIVGEQSKVQAQVKVGSLIILGHVEGDIEANELVEIRSGGQLNGDIITRRLVIEDGGCLNGCCNTID